MSVAPGPRSPETDAFSALSESLAAGWRRMTWLLFTGPNVSVTAWLSWGLILVVASPGGGGGGGNGGTQWTEQIDQGRFSQVLDRIEPWMVAAVLAAIVVSLLLGVLWLYFQSRFRLVMLEGVRSGVPRIRGVFGTTARDGLSYFFVELGAIVGFFILAIPVLVAWFPFVMRALRGGLDSGAELVVPIVATVFWLFPIAILMGVFRWWVYDLVLPHVVFGRKPFGEAIRRAWALSKARFGAVLLLLIGRFVIAAIAYCCVIPPVVLCTCLLWGPPAALAVPFIMLTIAAPIAAIATVPIVLVLAFVMIWIIATITAPVPLLFRAWSCAFVNQLDPEVPLWAEATPGTPEPPAPITPEETR